MPPTAEPVLLPHGARKELAARRHREAVDDARHRRGEKRVERAVVLVGVPEAHDAVARARDRNVAERGRASTEALNVLNIERQQWLVDNNVSQRSERVASVDNDVADLLSRGDLGEALRFPQHHGLPVQRLHVDRSQYDPSRLQPTWV